MNGLMGEPDKGAILVLEIMKSGAKVGAYIETHQVKLAEISGGAIEADLRDRLREWLNKTRELAKGLSPDSYSVTLSVPFVGSVSFTWPIGNEE